MLGTFLRRSSVIRSSALFGLCSNFAMTSVYSDKSGESDLYQTTIPVQTASGPVALDVVYQDTDHSDEMLHKGTVICVNGSPGSHNDFKYITPLLTKQGIRVIGVNFPGLGYTLNDYRLQHSNEERCQIITSLMDALKLDGNIIFLGHSRGCENALRMGATNKDKAVAVVLVNPIGFRHHRGVRPFWSLAFAAWLWNMSPSLQPILSPLYFKLYQYLGLKAKTGSIAGASLTMMATTDFGKQERFVRMLDDSDVQAVIAFSVKDHLIETELSKEFVNSFQQIKEMDCATSSEEDDIISNVVSELEKGQRNLAICFENESHFLQKNRPRLLAETISTLFKNRNKL